MKKDSKNRYDERRPFDVVRAEDFAGDLYNYYEPLEKLVRKVSAVDIEGSRPVFLIGGRGTGKTMVLKFLSVEMQLKYYIKEILKKDISISDLNSKQVKDFLKSKKFIGIYSRFRTTEYDQYKGEIAPLFKSYFGIKIGEKIFVFLKILKDSGLVSQQQELEITNFFIKQVATPKFEGKPNFNSILEFIRSEIIPMFDLIIEKSSHCSLDEIKRDLILPLVISKRIIFDLPDLIFSTFDFLEEKFLFVLLDELEYLNQTQIRFIGKLVKNSDETHVIFKIGARYLIRDIHVGESDQVLQDPHDFRVINIADSLNAANSGKKFEYIGLIKSILNRRLELSSYFKKKKITRIEQLFPNLSIEDEARKITKSRTKHWVSFKNHLRLNNSNNEIEKIIEHLESPENPIIEKLNMLLYRRGETPKDIKKMTLEYQEGLNKEYSELYQKNALNLLFQLCSDYRTEKKYSGIDVFINLSSGIVRYAIEICNQSLLKAYNYGYEPNPENPVDDDFQNLGARYHADLQYKDILRIPNNLGPPVQDFIEQIGTIFKALHRDRRLVEPEPTHFETEYSELKGRAKEVFDEALKYAYLMVKPPMEPKTIGETKKADFLLNRVFAPRFEISYRARGRTYISPSQIDRLITGDVAVRKRTRREVQRYNQSRRKKFEEMSENQVKLFSVIKGEMDKK